MIRTQLSWRQLAAIPGDGSSSDEKSLEDLIFWGTVKYPPSLCWEKRRSCGLQGACRIFIPKSPKNLDLLFEVLCRHNEYYRLAILIDLYIKCGDSWVLFGSGWIAIVLGARLENRKVNLGQAGEDEKDQED